MRWSGLFAFGFMLLSLVMLISFRCVGPHTISLFVELISSTICSIMLTLGWLTGDSRTAAVMLHLRIHVLCRIPVSTRFDRNFFAPLLCESLMPV